MTETKYCLGYLNVIDATQIPFFLSLLISLPLLIFIVFRLSTKKLQLNQYHYFLIVGCVNDMFATVLQSILFLIGLNPCKANLKIHKVVSTLLKVSSSLGLMFSALISVYWKSVMNDFGSIFVLCSLPTYTFSWIFPEQVRRIMNKYSTVLNILFEVPILSACYFSFVLVLKFDKGMLSSSQTQRGFRKMTISLFLQALFFTIQLVASIVLEMLEEILVSNSGAIESALNSPTFHEQTFLDNYKSIMIMLDIANFIARADQTTCTNQQGIPKCTGFLEGCNGESWLTGFHAFLLENSTQAVVLDPICCSSPSIHMNSNSCIHDQLNTRTKDFHHSIVSDLIYRGMQCWHQYNPNHTLVDLTWKMEICPFESDDFPVTLSDVGCEACDCECGIQQCSNGIEPVRVIHKKKIGKCGCECDCTFKCVEFKH